MEQAEKDFLEVGNVSMSSRASPRLFMLEEAQVPYGEANDANNLNQQTHAVQQPPYPSYSAFIPDLSRSTKPTQAGQSPYNPSFSGTTTFSPFQRCDPDPRGYEFFKIFLGLAVLIPIRLTCMSIVLVTYYIVARCYLLFLACFGSKQGSLFRRGTLQTPTRVTARILLFLCGFQYIEVFGNAHVRDDVHVLVSNHVGFWEVLYFLSSRSCPSFVFKKECLRVPFVGAIASTVLQGIQVNNQRRNDGGAQAIVARIQAMQTATSTSTTTSTTTSTLASPSPATAVAAATAYFRPLLVFPEGTTSNGTSLLTFRSGAFVAGVPVQPVLITLPFRHFSPTYESIYTIILCLRTLSQFHNRMQVRYLPVYHPSEKEKRNPTLFAKNVRRTMAWEMNVPVIDVTYQDKKVGQQVLADRLKRSSWGWVSNLWHVHPHPPPTEEETIWYHFYKPSAIDEEEKEEGGCIS